MTDKLRDAAPLLPCPFCGDDGDKGTQAVTLMNAERTSFRRVSCRCCGATCPEPNWNHRAALSQHSVYQLPDDLYPDSKCWVDGTYAERVEWLHTMYESSKQTLNVLLGQRDAQAVPQGEATVEEFSAWLNERRGMTVALVFHEVVAKFRAAVEQRELSEAFRTELDKVSQRNFELRMENASLKAAPTPPAQSCWCQTCRPITINDMRMVLCPTCGNKRCPHANDHRNPCTGSNEPGQTGSAYPSTTPPAQRVMLTDEEIEDLARGKSGHSDFARDIIEAYERKNGLRI